MVPANLETSSGQSAGFVSQCVPCVRHGLTASTVSGLKPPLCPEKFILRVFEKPVRGSDRVSKWHDSLFWSATLAGEKY